MEFNRFTSALPNRERRHETRERVLLLVPHSRFIVTLGLGFWNRLTRSAFATSFAFGN